MKSCRLLLSPLLLTLVLLFVPQVFAETPPYAAAEKELMVPVEGGKVYVRLNGLAHKAAIPVIFIHGGPGGTHNGFAGMTGL
ncbi:MAG: hypothetical protein VYD53_12280, partial [Pseudomonadota bacterium]|nr:hypothetical protein [Pseudomonadota bacterium]